MKTIRGCLYLLTALITLTACTTHKVPPWEPPPAEAAFPPPDRQRTDAARGRLDQLFGGSDGSPEGEDPARKALDDLFGPGRK